MLGLSRRAPSQCVFCAFQQTPVRFSTSAAAALGPRSWREESGVHPSRQESRGSKASRRPSVRNFSGRASSDFGMRSLRSIHRNEAGQGHRLRMAPIQARYPFGRSTKIGRLHSLRPGQNLNPPSRSLDREESHVFGISQPRRSNSFAAPGTNRAAQAESPDPRKSYTPGSRSIYRPLAHNKKESFSQTYALQLRFIALEERLAADPAIQRLGLKPEVLKTYFGNFKKDFESQGRQPNSKYGSLLQRIENSTSGSSNRQFFDVELKYAFYGFVAQTKFLRNVRQDQKDLLNFRFPADWFPATRQLTRDIHIHVGPTNSGKTYHALKRLAEAGSGVYGGPLRLLAHEVYERLNALGKPCALLTGDDRRAPAGTSIPMTSCTVEMMPLQDSFDVAVIDEIQLLGDGDRGWAWTQAFLGVQAKEVHVCGEPRTVSILEELAAACGDKVHIHRYERLTPLTMTRSLSGNFKALRKGDCVVAFSVQTLHTLRQSIERQTKKKCAIIYGSLPPETRAQQAKLFNDPDNEFDYLVASNAIGMGLNLSIKRLVFHSSGHRIGDKFLPLPIADVKQIAGRAGRFSTAADDNKRNAVESLSDTKPQKAGGTVTTLEDAHFKHVSEAMKSEPEPIASAGILPPHGTIEQFGRYFPSGTPFTFLLLQLQDLCRTNPRLHLCVMSQQLAIADVIESIKDLRIKDRFIFCLAPTDPRKPADVEITRVFAGLVANCKGASVVDIEELKLELLDGKIRPNREYLKELEQLHRSLILFLWLSYKFVGIFLDKPLAQHTKELVEQRIEQTLEALAVNFGKKKGAHHLELGPDDSRQNGEEAAGFAAPNGFQGKHTTMTAT